MAQGPHTLRDKIRTEKSLLMQTIYARALVEGLGPESMDYEALGLEVQRIYALRCDVRELRLFLGPTITERARELRERDVVYLPHYC